MWCWRFYRDWQHTRQVSLSGFPSKLPFYKKEQRPMVKASQHFLGMLRWTVDSRRPTEALEIVPDLLHAKHEGLVPAQAPSCLRLESCIWRKAIPNRRLISIKENGVYTKQSQKVHPDSLSLTCTIHTLKHCLPVPSMTSFSSPDKAQPCRSVLVTTVLF